MRVHEITCPKCHAGLKSKAGVPVGQSLTCPKCKNKFVVPEPEEPEDADIVDDTQIIEVEDEAPRKKGPPPPPRKKTVAREEERTEEIQLPKTKKTVKAQRDDEDEEEEEEEERKPKKKKKKKKRQDDDEEENLFLRLKHNIAVRIITMVILLGILAVAAYLLYAKRKAEAQDASRESERLAVVNDLDQPAKFG